MSGVTRWFASGLLAAVITLAVSPAVAQDDRKPKSKVDPAYPELAKRMHLSGTVKIEVTITPAGAIKATKVIGGNPVLVEAALEAVRKWKYEAGPDEATQILEFHFTGQ